MANPVTVKEARSPPKMAGDSDTCPIKVTKLKDAVNRQTQRWQQQHHHLSNSDSSQPNPQTHQRNLHPSQQISTRPNVDEITAKFENGAVVEPKRVVEPSKVRKTDVLVVGGGPAGLSAALAAKRVKATNGLNKESSLDVTLVESAGYFGGTITKTGMETMGWYRYPGTRECHSGLGREMERRAESMGFTSRWPFNESVCLHPHHFKYVADCLVKESGIKPLLHSRVVEVIMSDDVGREKNTNDACDEMFGDLGENESSNAKSKTIVGVILETPSGREAILAHRIIDTTGDAIVAYLAGAPFRKTHKPEMMGVTTVFGMEGVNKKKFEDHIAQNKATYKDWNTDTWEALTTGKEDAIGSPYWGSIFGEAEKSSDVDICGSWSAISPSGVATNLNLVHMKQVDPTHSDDVTRAEMTGREHVYTAIKVLQAKVPGFEEATLNSMSAHLGVRDSRYLDTGHRLNGWHVTNEGVCEDSIGVFPEFVDGHNILILPTTGRVFEVPLSMMIPQRVENLILAGRHVDVDPIASAAMRNMMACAVTGQGAGVAAAVSLLDGSTIREVEVKKIQSELRRQGVSISKADILEKEQKEADLKKAKEHSTLMVSRL